MSIYDKASLVLIPSGTKTSKVYSQKPVSGDGDFTFSRSTAATRVNADGNIEKETQNLLLQSNSYNTTWSGFNGASGQAGYDGTNNAWRYDSDSSVLRLQQVGINFSGVHTFSFYAKYVDAQWFALQIAGTTNESAWFDIQNGTLGSTSSAVDSSITSVGGGWYRCSVTGSASNQNRVRLYVVGSDGSLSNITASLLIQDAQLEQGLVARDYIETTTTAVEGGITDNVPRLDYTDSSCPALLLEPQRTNLFDHSEYFGDWGVTAGTLTANAGASPEGLNNAYLFTEDTTTGYHRFAKNAGGSGSDKTFSLYAKWAGGTGRKWLTLDNGPVGYFDLENGVTGAAGGSLSLAIEDAGDGWYRCTIYNPASFTGTMYIGCSDTNGGAGNHLGNGQPAFYCYGAQCEDNSSYATSYIPTYGSAVTRNVDDITTTFSSPIPTTGNVSYFIHLDGSDRSGNATGSHAAIRFQGNDYISYNVTGGGYHRIRVNVNSNSNYYSGNIVKSQEAKILAVINGDYIKIFMNGQQRNQGTLSDVPDMLSATEYTGVSNEALGPLPINQIMLFPTALTDQEAIDLTTL